MLSTNKIRQTHLGRRWWYTEQLLTVKRSVGVIRGLWQSDGQSRRGEILRRHEIKAKSTLNCSEFNNVKDFQMFLFFFIALKEKEIIFISLSEESEVIFTKSFFAS